VSECLPHEDPQGTEARRVCAANGVPAARPCRPRRVDPPGQPRSWDRGPDILGRGDRTRRFTRSLTRPKITSPSRATARPVHHAAPWRRYPTPAPLPAKTSPATSHHDVHRPRGEDPTSADRSSHHTRCRAPRRPSDNCRHRPSHIPSSRCTRKRDTDEHHHARHHHADHQHQDRHRRGKHPSTREHQGHFSLRRPSATRPR